LKRKETSDLFDSEEMAAAFINVGVLSFAQAADSAGVSIAAFVTAAASRL